MVGELAKLMADWGALAKRAGAASASDVWLMEATKLGQLSASHALDSAHDLSEQAGILRGHVQAFLSGIRIA